nr:hypothetical protein [Prevotella sp.]
MPWKLLYLAMEEILPSHPGGCKLRSAYPREYACVGQGVLDGGIVC